MQHFRPIFWRAAVIGFCAALIAACAVHKALAFAAALLLIGIFTWAGLSTQCTRLLPVLQRARRIRQIRAARAPAAICTDDIH